MDKETFLEIVKDKLITYLTEGNTLEDLAIQILERSTYRELREMFREYTDAQTEEDRT